MISHQLPHAGGAVHFTQCKQNIYIRFPTSSLVQEVQYTLHNVNKTFILLASSLMQEVQYTLHNVNKTFIFDFPPVPLCRKGSILYNLKTKHLYLITYQLLRAGGAVHFKQNEVLCLRFLGLLFLK